MGVETGAAERARTTADEDSTKPPPLESVTVVILSRNPDGPAFTEDELDTLQGRHLAYLASLGPPGPLVLNGPVVDPPDAAWRGLSVYRLPLAEAMAHAEADPMVRARRLAVRGFTWLMRRGSLPGAIPWSRRTTEFGSGLRSRRRPAARPGHRPARSVRT